jgi:hypothetical protein
MPEPVLSIVRSLWNEVSFGQELTDRSFANAARLLRNRVGMRKAFYRARHDERRKAT